MSLQDDYFDVRAALGETPEAEYFERIWGWACKNEAELAVSRGQLSAISNAMRVLRDLGKGS